MRTPLFLCLFLLSLALRAQPGPFGADLYFSLRNPGELKQVLVFWNSEISGQKIKLLPDRDGMYWVEGLKSPLGGGVNGRIEIVYKKDTMYVYPPSSVYLDVHLESIPFRRGHYYIPDEHFFVWRMLKPEYRAQVSPRLDGDWSDFELGSDLLPHLVLRRLETFRTAYPGLLLWQSRDCAAVQAPVPPPVKEYFKEGLPGMQVYARENCYFFGVFTDRNIYLLQRDSGAVLEYGCLEIPAGDSPGSEIKLLGKEKWARTLPIGFDFKAQTLFSAANPVLIGYYSRLTDCPEEQGKMYENQGVYEVQIDRPDAGLMKTIVNEHRADNCLPARKE